MAGFSALAKINGVLIFAGYPAFLFLEAVRRRKPWKTAASRVASAAAGFAASFAVPFGFFSPSFPERSTPWSAFTPPRSPPPPSLYFSSRPPYRPLDRKPQLRPRRRRPGLRSWPDEPERRRTPRASAGSAPFSGRPPCGLAVIFVPGDFFIRYAVFAFVPRPALRRGGEALAGENRRPKDHPRFRRRPDAALPRPDPEPEKDPGPGRGDAGGGRHHPAKHEAGGLRLRRRSVSQLPRPAALPGSRSTSRSHDRGRPDHAAESPRTATLFNVKMVFVETGPPPITWSS